MTVERLFLILKAGSLLPLSPGFVDRFGDTEQTFITGSGLSRQEAHVIDIQSGEQLPQTLDGYSGVMISGSSAMVSSQAPWMLSAGAWLRSAVASNIPILGICFGHQLLAHALGGRIGPNPKGVEGGTVDVEFAASDDPLFEPMRTRVPLQAHHYETVLEPPSRSTVLARSEFDDYHAMRHAPRAWSVQFHPELTMPMMHILMDALAVEGDPHGHGRMRDGLRPSPEGPKLLRRFVSLAQGDEGRPLANQTK